MNKEKIRTYDELNMDEREVLDSFRRIKLLWDQTRFRLYKYKIEDLLTDYEQMIQLRQGIQAKYYEIINELNEVDLIEGELDSHKWVMHREQKDLVWSAEMQLLDGIKSEFVLALQMIDSGEVEQQIIDAQN